MKLKGTYTARVAAHTWERSSTGTSGLAIEWEVTEGELKGQRFHAKPRYLTANTVERLRSELRVMGWTGEPGTEFEGPGMGSCECQIVIPEEQDTEKDVDVRWINPLRGLRQERPKAKKDEIAALFAAGPKSAPTGGGKGSARGAGMPDDDFFGP